MDDIRITRDVEVDLPDGELWSLVAEPDGWAVWLVDDADVAIEPGATGTVTDDGEVREVRIERVEPDRSVTFSWWSDQRAPSTVQLEVLPRRLVITETLPAPVSASAELRWDVRALVVCSLARAVAHV